MSRLFEMIGETAPFSLISTKQVISQREDLANNLNAITLKLANAALRKDTFLQEENLIVHLMKLNEGAPMQTVKRLQSHEGNS